MLLTLILVEHLDIGLTYKPLLYHPQIPPILDEVDIYCKLIYPFVTWQLVIKPDELPLINPIFLPELSTPLSRIYTLSNLRFCIVP